MRFTTRLGICVAALALTGPVLAQAPGAPTDFKTLDKNQDGKISSLEADAKPELHISFEGLDANHDGFLTPMEFSKWSGAGKIPAPVDSTTGPSGSSGAQHMPAT